MKKWLPKLLAIIFVIAVLIEFSVRATGITDFPLYEANNEIGYILKPSQSGSFRHKNSWRFNSKSMGAKEFTPSKAIDNLLVGDSIVLGGNPYKEEDRLGPQLSSFLKEPVWPISAGSWALLNELTYLRIHSEVVNDSDRIIFVLNNGDFDQASSWSCEQTHPRTRPLLTSIYVFQKYVYNWTSCDTVPKLLRVPPRNWKVDLHAFLSSDRVGRKEILFFLYPEKDEVLGKKLVTASLEFHAAEIAAESTSPISIYSVRRDPRWKAEFYHDSIHPTVQGTKVLAQIISSPAANTKLP
jgi:hypothetical protein